MFAYVGRGLAYGGKGNYDKAIKDFTKAIDLDLDLADLAAVYHHRGLAYDNKGDKTSAKSDYEKAEELGYNKSKSLVEQIFNSIF